MSTSAEEQIFTTLTATFAGSPTLVSGVYPDALPQEVLTPAVVYRRVGTDPVAVLNGSIIGAARVTIAVESWAGTRAAAELLGSMINTAMITAGHIPGEREGVYDEESRQFAALQHFDVWET